MGRGRKGSRSVESSCSKGRGGWIRRERGIRRGEKQRRNWKRQEKRNEGMCRRERRRSGAKKKKCTLWPLRCSWLKPLSSLIHTLHSSPLLNEKTSRDWFVTTLRVLGICVCVHAAFGVSISYTPCSLGTPELLLIWFGERMKERKEKDLGKGYTK